MSLVLRVLRNHSASVFSPLPKADHRAHPAGGGFGQDDTAGGHRAGLLLPRRFRRGGQAIVARAFYAMQDTVTPIVIGKYISLRPAQLAADEAAQAWRTGAGHLGDGDSAHADLRRCWHHEWRIGAGASSLHAAHLRRVRAGNIPRQRISVLAASSPTRPLGQEGRFCSTCRRLRRTDCHVGLCRLLKVEELAPFASCCESGSPRRVGEERAPASDACPPEKPPLLEAGPDDLKLALPGLWPDRGNPSSASPV